MAPMKLTPFLRKHKLQYFGMNLEVTGSEKKPVGVDEAHRDLYHSISEKGYDCYYGLQTDFTTKKNKQKLEARQALLLSEAHGFNTIAVDTTGVYQLDVDDESVMQHPVIKELLTSCPYYLSTTKKLPHFFITVKEQVAKNVVKILKDSSVRLELLSGQWAWAPIDAEVYNAAKPFGSIALADFADEPDYCIRSSKPPKPTEVEKVIFVPPPDKLSQIDKYLEMMDSKFINSRTDFTAIVWAIKKEGGSKEVAKAFGERSIHSKKYFSAGKKCFSEWFEPIWDADIDGYGMGTIKYYARRSDEEAYLAMERGRYPDAMRLDSDDALAEMFLSLSPSDYIFQDGTVYIFNNRFQWVADTGKMHLNYHVGKELVKMLTGMAEEEQDPDSIKVLRSLIRKSSNTNSIASISQRVRQILSVKDFDDIVFDRQGHLIPFKNRAYDLNQSCWVDICREDYILSTTGYDYKEPNQEQMDTLTQLIERILPDPEIRECYIHCLAIGLYGEMVEKFIIATGSGGNGKGLINELHQAVLGDRFGYTAPNNILLNPMKAGPNPELANMNNKRTIFYREPDPTQYLVAAVVKELSGGSEINARACHSNNTKVQLKCIQILECNEIPKISGEISDALFRRLMVIPFESTFTDDKSLQALPNHFPANTYYKTTDFKKEYRCAFFKYLITWISDHPDPCKHIPIPPRVQKLTNVYLQDSDVILSWMMEHYERTADKVNDMVLVKDIFNEYKGSEAYYSLPRKVQIQWKMKKFKEYIQTSSLKVLFRPHIQTKEAKDQHCDQKAVLVGFKRSLEDTSETVHNEDF